MMLMLRSAIQFGWGVQLRSLQPGVIQRPYVLFDVLQDLAQARADHRRGAGPDDPGAPVADPDPDRQGDARDGGLPELARLTGIETEKVIRATWIIGAGLATAAGVFLALDTQVETMMGWKILLPLFASAILGGIGSAYGAMVGGLVIGIAEELSTYPWLGDDPLLAPGYKPGVAFAIMVIMLIWRPTGLFRGRLF